MQLSKCLVRKRFLNGAAGLWKFQLVADTSAATCSLFSSSKFKFFLKQRVVRLSPDDCYSTDHLRQNERDSIISFR